MGSFRLEWRRSTKKDLRRIAPHEVVRIVAATQRLTGDPFPPGSEKLSGSEHAYRIRIGDYRVVYEVFPELGLVAIERVAHRKDVYRK